MTLEFHADAQASFDRRADALLALLEQRTLAGGGPPRWVPDLHTGQPISAEDVVGEPDFGHADLAGRYIARFFGHGGTTVGLFDEGHKNLERLCVDMQRTPTLRSHVGHAYLEIAVFHWLRAKYRGELGERMTTYVLRRCAEDIRQLEVWLPIGGLAVEKGFSIVGVDIRSMDATRVDTWLAGAEAAAQSLPEKQAVLNELRRDFQGMAACVLTVVAEPIHALDLVESKARIAVAALRLFDPASSSSTLVSRLDLLGRAPILERRAIMEHGGKSVITRGADPRQLQSCGLQVPQIDLAVGLFAPLTKALQSSPIGEFAESVLNSLLTYSQASLRVEPGDRLVTVFSGLEMLLLRDENEAIAQNLGERMAFCSTGELNERRKIAKCVREAYGLRSKVVHHGLAVTDSDLIEEFYIAAIKFYCSMLENMGRYETRAQFFDWIERLKFA